MDKSEKVNIEDQSIDENEVIVIVFYGVVALGKSHFLRSFKQYCEPRNINLTILSSDSCSKTIIDQIKEEKPNLSAEEYFQLSRPRSMKLWKNLIKDAFDSLKPGHNLIILDRVRNPPEFTKNIFENYPCPSYRKRLFAIIPEDTGKFFYGDKHFVPLSPSLIINVCHRILFRESHETIFGEPGHRIHLALSFVLLFEDVENIEQSMKELGPFEKFFQVSFHQEMEKNIPSVFLEQLKRAMEETQPFQEVQPASEDLSKLFMDKEKITELEPILNFARNEDQKNAALKILDQFGKN